MTQIELLALSRSLDDICVDNDISPEYVIEKLLDDGLINLDQYFPEDDDD